MNPKHDQLRHGLRAYATDLAATVVAPPASVVWIKAQRRARQAAFARATLPLRVMSAIGIAAAILTAIFVVDKSWTTPSPAALRALLTWTAPAAALLIAGSWSLLRCDPSKPTPTLTPTP